VLPASRLAQTLGVPELLTPPERESVPAPRLAQANH
jgi:hypothetical protein